MKGGNVLLRQVANVTTFQITLRVCGLTFFSGAFGYSLGVVALVPVPFTCA